MLIKVLYFCIINEKEKGCFTIMDRTLYIGFKGKNNASRVLVESISADSYLLTNSFSGLKSDIELLSNFYDCVILFGVDKNLKDTVRIEKVAEKETKEFTALNLEVLSTRLNAVGVSNYLSDKPTHYLCNDAYWHLLRKFNGNALLIHIPSGKNISENMLACMKQVFR